MAKDKGITVVATGMAPNLGDGMAAKPAPDVHFVGLVKSPQPPGKAELPRYTVVTGTIDKPVYDTVAQPLGNAVEAAKIAWLKLLDVIP